MKGWDVGGVGGVQRGRRKRRGALRRSLRSAGQSVGAHD